MLKIPIRLLKVFGIAVSVIFNFKFNGPASRQGGPEKLRLFLEKAGGAFIKLGQILALRQDFLSQRYIVELLKLLSGSSKASFVEMQRIFLEEKGVLIGKFFSEFDDEPVASGSIAQVYRARLKNGEEVAVKIQKPGVKNDFEVDFSLIFFWACIFDFLRIFSSVRAVEVATEFISWTKKELDFTYEAKNADALYRHSQKHPQTIIPRQYFDLTTPKVLIQEFIKDGVKAEEIIFNRVDRAGLAKNNIDLEKLSSYLVKDEMRQYFIDGFFHADPHPANLIFLPDNKLVYLDFGIVGEVKENRNLFLRAFYGVAKKDIDFLSRHFFEYGKKVFDEEIESFARSDIKHRRTITEIVSKIHELIMTDFKKDMVGIIQPWFNAVSNPYSTIYEKSATVVFLKILKKAEEYGAPLPREAILFFRALCILDMVSLQLSPGFDMIKALNGFFEDYPLEIAEKIIEEGLHRDDAGKIISTVDIDWEFFKEVSALEKEKRDMIKEKMLETIFYYAEKYEEIKSLLKTIK
jgi:ubiquinone biosynthesis protein